MDASSKFTLHNPIQIVTVAVYSPRKGSSLIPDILFELIQKGLKIHWHCIGKFDGNAGEKEYLKTLMRAKELDVSKYLTLHGSKSWDELKQVYENSDIFVLPTYAEGVPRVLLEAQAAGLPIVTTSVGGIPAAIQNGQNGIIVPPGDPIIIANAIFRIIQDKHLFNQLIIGGIETAKEFCLESETKRMIEQVSKFYDI